MNDQHYRVSIGTYDLDLAEELHHPAGAAPISFVPVVAGAGATGRIIIGVALIALSFRHMPAWLQVQHLCRVFIWHLHYKPYAYATQAGLLSGHRTRHRRRCPAPNTHAKDQQRRRRPTQEL
jgi:hypothetical protein